MGQACGLIGHLLSVALFVLLVPHAVEGQPSAVDPWIVEIIYARELGPRTIYVATPLGYDRAKGRYPVLVALDVAARRPDAFQGIIAMSPAIWFNDGTLVDSYADLILKSASHPRLFLTSGVVVEEPDVEEPTRRLAQRLKTAGGGNDWAAHRAYPDATHSLTPLSLADGLRFVFDPVSHRHLAIEKLDPATADAAGVNAAIASSERAYAEAARSLRLPEQLAENVLNRLAYRLLNNKKAALAIRVFERNVRAYPDSLNVYDGLAEALIAAGDTASAVAQLQTAANVARRTGVMLPATIQKKLDALTAKKN